MFRALVYDRFHNHAAAAARRCTRRINLERPNRTPLSSRTPIAIKLVVRILRGVLIRMLLPLRIVEPDPVGNLKLFFLESVEEFRNPTIRRKITIAPGQPG